MAEAACQVEESACLLVAADLEMEVEHLEAACLLDIQVEVQLPWEAEDEKDILEVGGLAQILVAVLASSVERPPQVEVESLVLPKFSCHSLHSHNS